MHAWVLVGSAAVCGRAYFLQQGFYLMDESEKDSGPPVCRTTGRRGKEPTVSACPACSEAAFFFLRESVHQIIADLSAQSSHVL